MLQQFLHDFGYFALFLGTFFEGETILVLAGFLAFRGYMDINLVVVVAFFGSYAGDQLSFSAAQASRVRRAFLTRRRIHKPRPSTSSAPSTHSSYAPAQPSTPTGDSPAPPPG